MVGQTLAHYEILEKLGQGGMGDVYRAHDPRLGRDVAIKLLKTTDSDRLRRFEQEARAASALNHPNIITIYEVGTHDGTPYISMEYVEGRTLRDLLTDGPLSDEFLRRYAPQLAEGLAKAHQAGIVHRDLKPENVIVTADGYVKILDFGLAKLSPLAEEGSELETAVRQGTAPGTILGTVGYMSPEQVRGEEADTRSDVFSFGAVLYEMLSGRRAFRRDTAVETMNAILKEEPPELATGRTATAAGFESIVHRCLRKRVTERFDSARELTNAIEALTSGNALPDSARGRADRKHSRARKPAGVRTVVVATAVLGVAAAFLIRASLSDRVEPPSGNQVATLAVLPFENVGGDPEAEYLSDGVAETLLNSLARLSDLKVTARALSFRFDGAVDPLQAGRELGVDAVVTGRVSLEADTLVVGAELVHVTDGTQLWGQRYDRRAGDLALVHRTIASEIAGQLRAELSGDEQRRLTGGGTESAEAYDLYLKGLHHWNKVDPEGMRAAAEYFQRAIGADPSYALPHVGLANVFSTTGYMGMAKPQVIWPMVKSEATRALELDDTLAAAHAALGHAVMFHDWDWPAAKQSLDRRSSSTRTTRRRTTGTRTIG